MKSLLIIGIIAVAMIGTIMVDEVYGVEENVEEVSPLTINSLEIYEDADYTRSVSYTHLTLPTIYSV